MAGKRLAAAWTRAAAGRRPLPEYPRPQLVRSSWLSLNGRWEFWGGRDATGPDDPPGAGECAGPDDPPIGRRLPDRIVVPFPVESRLSGIGTGLERMWYRRTFRVPHDWATGRVHLHFGAVDWECRVWVNGAEVGAHRGGYDAFSFDVTPHLTWSDEEVLVHVLDPTDGGGQPLGKQRRHPGGIFYTAASGIWQTVWLEPTPSQHIRGLSLTPDLRAGAVEVLVHLAPADAEGQVQVDVRAGLAADAETVAAGAGTSGRPFAVTIPNVRTWSPDDPFLYAVTVTLAGADPDRPDRAAVPAPAAEPGQATRPQPARMPDRVDSYVGMRSIEVADVAGEPRPLLNGRFVFQLGLLDQGYWPDGVYTAPSDDDLRRDLEVAKALGFTCVRKHAKAEPARWYHWADRLGLLVWQDIPSMPHDRVPDEAARRQFETELAALVEQLRAFPSLIGWVPFNEGWGQYDVARIAQLVRTLDPTRLVSENSGSADPTNDWADARAGHVADRHAYPGPGAVAPSPGRCRALGEFGGIGLSLAGHTWPGTDGFSYEWVAARDGLTDRYVGMVDELRALARDQGLSIAVYTQATDVEGECNGLLTYDRTMLKVDLDRVRAAHQRLYDEIAPPSAPAQDPPR